MNINTVNVNKMGASNIPVKDKQALGMSDFLSLMVAQMQNQDVMNPMDNTQFVAQLAQFSSLQALTDNLAITQQNQAMSLLGKNVLVTDDTTNTNLEGLVEGITFKNKTPYLNVNGMLYEFSDIKQIKMTAETEQVGLKEVIDAIDSIGDRIIEQLDPIDDPVIDEIIDEILD